MREVGGAGVEEGEAPAKRKRQKSERGRAAADEAAFSMSDSAEEEEGPSVPVVIEEQRVRVSRVRSMISPEEQEAEEVARKKEGSWRKVLGGTGGNGDSEED